MIDFDPDFLDSVCITLSGRPIAYQTSVKTYKGHPAYHFCTNAPASRAYMRHQLASVLSLDVDMVLLDAYFTTPLVVPEEGGCFCRWCMEGLRYYLRENVTRERLAACGVDTIDGFDYGEFLRDRGVTREQFLHEVELWPPRLPLAQEFVDFQYKSAGEFMAEFRREFDRLSEGRVALSINSPLDAPRDLYPSRYVDFFCSETRYEFSAGAVPHWPVFHYKLGDALQRPMVVTCQARRFWVHARNTETVGLARMHIAQAYAYGHHFMVPDRMWCGPRESRWYESRPGDYDYLYMFVRQNAELFDEYDDVAHVGVVYSNAAFRRGATQAKDICTDLALDNVPVRLVVAGDEWLPNRLTLEDLRALEAVIVTEPAYLDAEQQAVLETANERVIVWPDAERLFRLVPREVIVEGASNVTVVPRAKSTGAPFVCHLLNRNYVADKDTMQVQRDFTVTVSDSLFGVGISSANLYAPGREPIGCGVRPLDGGTEITVPELDVWAVLELTGT